MKHKLSPIAVRVSTMFGFAQLINHNDGGDEEKFLQSNALARRLLNQLINHNFGWFCIKTPRYSHENASVNCEGSKTTDHV